MAETTIEWTDATWNPVTGCSKVSPGCAHCYAETVAARFWPTQYPRVESSNRRDIPEGVLVHPSEPRAFTDVRCHEDRLDQPLRWRKPRKVFANSMSDLFHEDVPDIFIERVFSVMALAERHIFQVLTKRPDRMLAWFRARRFDVKNYAILQTEMAGECLYAHPWPLPNVWLGVSVENQHFADERIPLLLQTPAAVRFLSCEPLLEGLDIAKHRPGANRLWIIAGGESGPKSRICRPAWIRSIVRQAQEADCPVFVKQLGANIVTRNDDGWEGDTTRSWPMDTQYDENIHGYRDEFQGADVRVRLNDRKGGDPSEWPEDLRVRQFPKGLCSESDTPTRG